jgi:curved DNA-binding protein CbpA
VEWPYGAEVPDLYGLLGVAASASREEVARAYRRKVHTSHPDAHPDDPGASARFRALTRAYGVLSDPERRADYDRRRARTRPQATPPQAQGRRIDIRAWPSPMSSAPPDSALASGPAVGPLLWAGPVHVEPPEPPTGPRRDYAGLAELAEMLDLLTDYLDEWGWPR